MPQSPVIPTLDPEKVIITVWGVTIQQLKKGTFVTVSRDADAYTDDISADGFATRIKIADKRGSIKFTTDRASLSNDYLTGLAVADETLPIPIVGPSSVVDLAGGSEHLSAATWIKKIPDAPYATENTGLEWEIRCGYLSHQPVGVIPT